MERIEKSETPRWGGGAAARLIVSLSLAAICAVTGRCAVEFGTMGAVKSAGKALDRKSLEAGSAAPSTPAATCTDQQLADLEQSMTSALSTSTISNFYTLMLESADGRSYVHSAGTSTATTSFQSASTSKFVTAVVILSLADRGFLTLDSRPQDLISWWAPASTNPAYGVTLRHLMGFTSGLMVDPPTVVLGLTCLDLPNRDIESCVQDIYDMNVASPTYVPPAPGTQFYYASTHLQIAGLMAVKARGYSNWNEVFDEFKSRTGLFPNSTYDLPSSTNPRLAGGMHWTGDDYLGFLRALYKGQLLSAGMRAELWADQRGAAAVVATPSGGLSSPLLNPIPIGLGEDWHYGLGNWVEMENSSGGWLPVGRNSSPGAYGAYPFIDFKYGYIGIVARQSALGSFPEGIDLFRTVAGIAPKWATKSCGN